MPTNTINKKLVEPIRKEIGRNFRNQRLRAQMTPYLLGKKCKVTRKVIYDIEKGTKNYTIDSLIAALGVIYEKPTAVNNINIIYKSAKIWGTHKKMMAIHRMVCDMLDVSRELVRRKSKEEIYLKPRYYAFKLMYELTKARHEDIAVFYNKDRVTVLQGIREMDNLIAMKDKLSKDYPTVEKTVKKALGYEVRKN